MPLARVSQVLEGSYVFSRRIPWTLSENPLAAELSGMRLRKEMILDLSVSNPTEVGLEETAYSGEMFEYVDLETYTPTARGLIQCREAISRYYADDGKHVPPDNVHCTSGSSEAYAFLFKLLCNPGDSVLTPLPAYPLFEHLAALDGVRIRPYNLRRSPLGRWRIDVASLDHAYNESSRAVIVVNPTNPLGEYLDPDDMRQLRSFCCQRNLPLIVDEVFWDFDLGGRDQSVRTVEEQAVLCFTLNGLSKLAALPQLKLAWIVTSGPSTMLEDALVRLDFIADAYLSVGTPVMQAAEALLARRGPVQQCIRERCKHNLGTLCELLVGCDTLLACKPKGGWSVVLDISRYADEESLALRLLRDQAVFVYPGYFFDFPVGKHLVLSLLPEPQVFAEGVRRLLVFLQRMDGLAVGTNSSTS